MKGFRTIYVLAAAAFLAGCSAVKECADPEVCLPAEYASGTDEAGSVADLEWWEFYTDTTLTSLIRKALLHNREFLGAAAAVEQSRQLYGVAKADMFPTVGIKAYAQRETNDYGGDGTSGDPEIGLKAALGWEVDLWGNQRWKKRGGEAAYQASVEEWRAMKISLIAETATAYFSLVALDNELQIVRRTLDTRRQELDKARLRYEGGLTSEIVYLQAQVEYKTAEALVPNIEKRIDAMQNALSVLTGEFSGKPFVRSASALGRTMPQSVPVGIPSTLLERRPDLRAAMARLAKATSDVGVAYTNRFPRFNIDLVGGVESDYFSTLLKSPFSFIGAALAGPVLDFGRLKKKYKASVAAYERERYAYEQCVLEAFRETADAITGYGKARETAASRLALRDAALKYMNLAHLQYTAGSISYLGVLDAQRRYFDAQISHSNAVRDELLALVDLYKCLGGGWNVREEVPRPS